MKAVGRVVGVVGTAALALAPALWISPAGAEPQSQVFTTVGTTEWVVPAGVTCVTAQAIGAEGGSNPAVSGDAVSASSNGNGPSASVAGEGAQGGSGTSTFPMVPGASLQINVGGRGGDVADSDATDVVGGAGGFNGGGDGGTPTVPAWDEYSAGAGGGGASDVRAGGSGLDSRIAVGGGGGGFGGFGGTTAGVGGGDVGGDGGAQGSSTGGTGGTDSAGGVGGQTDGGAPTGGDAAFDQGGDGAGDASVNGGGGGGGGGWFGGGGGGGVQILEGAAAAGGGGSGFGADVVSDVDAGNGGNGSVTLTYEAGDTSCVAAPLTVTKTAVGAATPGTTFTMHVACENATIAFGVSELSDVDLQFTVDESGTVQPAVGQSIGFYGPNDCTVTETGNGGATSTSYECVGSGASEIDDVSAGSARWDGGVGVATAANPDDPCVTSGPQAEAMEVTIVDPNQEATVAVTNVLPAAAVALQPRFTG